MLITLLARTSTLALLFFISSFSFGSCERDCRTQECEEKLINAVFGDFNTFENTIEEHTSEILVPMNEPAPIKTILANLVVNHSSEFQFFEAADGSLPFEQTAKRQSCAGFYYSRALNRVLNDSIQRVTNGEPPRLVSRPIPKWFSFPDPSTLDFLSPSFEESIDGLGLIRDPHLTVGLSAKFGTYLPTQDNEAELQRVREIHNKTRSWYMNLAEKYLALELAKVNRRRAEIRESVEQLQAQAQRREQDRRNLERRREQEREEQRTEVARTENRRPSRESVDQETIDWAMRQIEIINANNPDLPPLSLSDVLD